MSSNVLFPRFGTRLFQHDTENQNKLCKNIFMNHQKSQRWPGLNLQIFSDQSHLLVAGSLSCNFEHVMNEMGWDEDGLERMLALTTLGARVGAGAGPMFSLCFSHSLTRTLTTRDNISTRFRRKIFKTLRYFTIQKALKSKWKAIQWKTDYLMCWRRMQASPSPWTMETEQSERFFIFWNQILVTEEQVRLHHS